MATKQELRTAFQRQGSSLGPCCSGASDPLASQCLGLRGRRQQIAARVPAWSALPSASPEFDAVISALNASSDRLANAASDEECLEAIAAAHSALGGLEHLLDGAGQ